MLAFGLGNYPNPFNPGTVIAFELSNRARVSLNVYDLGGRLVRTLVDGQYLDRGRHEAAWDGRGRSGNLMASGVYIYRLEAGTQSESRRMVLVK